MDDTPLTNLHMAYLAHHEALGRSNASIYHHAQTYKLLLRFLAESGFAPVQSVLTTATAQSYARWLRDTPTKGWRGSTVRSPHGVHGALKDLRSWVRWMIDAGHLDRVVKVPVPRLPHRLFAILTDEEMTRLWASKYLASSGDQAIRNRAIIALMLDTGVRVSEVAGMTIADLDVANCLATVIGKGDRQRRVPFSTGVLALLEDWLEVRGPEPGSLFWLKQSGIRQLFDRIRDDAGLAVFHPHMLRHQAATLMVRNHADLHTVKRILGHQQLATVELYLSMDDEDIRRKHALSSPFEAVHPTVQTPAKRHRERRRLLI